MTSAHDLSHDHVFLGARHDEKARRTMWVVWLTAAMMIVEIAAGYWTGSMALLADGFHMATHAGALGIAAAAYAYARRHAQDRRFSFGAGKVGDLAGFASALILGVIALAIAVESVRRFFAPANVAFDEATLIAVLGLAVNLVSALLLGHGHDHAHDHHHTHAPMLTIITVRSKCVRRRRSIDNAGDRDRGAPPQLGSPKTGNSNFLRSAGC